MGDMNEYLVIPSWFNLRFYLNETEQLRVEKFRVYTHLNFNESQSIAEYPIEILKRIENKSKELCKWNLRVLR